MKHFLQQAATILLFCAAIDFSCVAQPVALFSISNAEALCNPADVSFTNLSTGSTTLTYQWYFSNDTVPDTSINPTHLFSDCGTYTVTLIATDTFGLSDSLSQDVIIHCTPQSLFSFAVNSLCDSATVHFSDASVSADSIASWQWNFGDTASGNVDSSAVQNPDHFYAAPGVYVVSFNVATVHGCTSVFYDTVEIHSPPSAEFSFSTSSKCFGDSVKFFDASVSTDSITEWAYNFGDPGSGANNIDHSPNPVHIFSSAGNFNVTLTVKSVWGCESEVVHAIAVNTLPVITASSDQNLCIGDSVQLHVTGAVSYLWNPATSLSSDSVSNPIAFPSVTTAYVVSGIDSNGCRNSDSVIVTVHQTVVAASNDTVICFGTSLMLTATGADFYSWNPAASLSDSSIANPIATPTSYTKYFVTGTDSFGCASTDSVSVSVHTITVDAGSDATICAGSSTMLNATGGISYQWQPSIGLSNDTISNPIASPESTTTYTVTAKDSFGCSGSDSVLVSVHSSLSVQIIGLAPYYCADHGLITLQGIPEGGVFSGSGVTGNQFNPSLLVPNQFYTISYSVTDSNGCAGADSVSVFINPLPAIQITPSSAGTCVNGNAIAFTLSPQGGTLSGTGISGNTFDPQLTGGAGNYVITYSASDSFGCFNKDSLTITVHSLPVIIASGDTTICFGDSAQLHASGAVNYYWLPGSYVTVNTIPDPKAFPPASINFIVQGVDSFGCAGFDSVQVNVVNTNDISVSNDTAVCFGNNVTLSASGADSYSWSPGNLLNDSTIANPVTSILSTTVFTLNSSIGVCHRVDSVSVIVHPLPAVSAGNDTSACFGIPSQLHASGAQDYVWHPGNLLSDSTVSDPTALPVTTTSFTVTGTDVYGCSATDELLFTVYALPQLSVFVDSAICFGDSVPMFATGALVYYWQPTLGLSSPLTSSTLAYPQVTTTYAVFGFDSHGCESTADTTIVVHPLPVISVSNDQVICPDHPVQLFASGGESFSWLPQQGLNDASIANPIATVSSNITYTVTVTDTNFCKSKDSVSLTMFPALNASVSNDTIVCTGTSAQLFASGGVNYVWIPMTGLNDGNIPNPVSSPEATTSYTVYVSDGFCYTDTLNVKVTVQDVPIVNAGADVQLISGSSYQFNIASTDGTFEWLPETGLNCATCKNPLASPQQTTTYTVTVTDSAGCKASDDVTITIACGDDIVFVPNAFTPNDNGHNDKFFIRALGNLTLHYLRVYDRWGKIIFESHDFDNGWDGTDNGKPMMPGAYLYEWSVSCENGTEVKKEGNVTLLR